MQAKKYRVSFKPVADKWLRSQDKHIRLRIVKAALGLAENPYPPGVRRLVGRDGLRIRVGDYRVVYEVRDDLLLVLIVQVGHRREIYR